MVFFNLSPRINCFLSGEKDLWKELFRELNPAQVLFRLTWLRMKEFFLSRRLFKPGKIQRLPGSSQQATSSLRVYPRVKRRRGNVYANLTLIAFSNVTPYAKLYHLIIYFTPHQYETSIPSAYVNK